MVLEGELSIGSLDILSARRRGDAQDLVRGLPAARPHRSSAPSRGIAGPPLLPAPSEARRKGSEGEGVTARYTGQILRRGGEEEREAEEVAAERSRARRGGMGGGGKSR